MTKQLKKMKKTFNLLSFKDNTECHFDDISSQWKMLFLPQLSLLLVDKDIAQLIITSLLF